MGKVREIREKLDKYVAQNYAPPMFLQRFGKGEWLYGLLEEADGSDSWRSVLDLHSNYSATSLGHNYPQLVALRNKRSEENRVVFISRGGAMSEELADLGEKVRRLSGMEMMLPKNVGTEQFDLVVKLARLWGYKILRIPEGKAEIIVCGKDYLSNFHGRSLAATEASTNPELVHLFGPFGPRGAFRKIPFGDLSALEKAINEYTAAFVAEPIQAEAGVIIPHEGYLREARRICRENRVLFILDEIQTGLGRTGKLFAWQHEGEEARPDGMMLGKALGGGLAKISLLVLSKEVLGLLGEGSEGSTFGGDPESCAIASMALDIMSTPSFLKRVEMLGEEFVRKLRTIDSPLVIEARGKGLLVAVEVDPRCNVRQIWEELIKAGILCIKRKNALGFSPPLTINEHNLLVYGFKKIKRVFENTECALS